MMKPRKASDYIPPEILVSSTIDPNQTLCSCLNPWVSINEIPYFILMRYLSHDSVKRHLAQASKLGKSKVVKSIRKRKKVLAVGKGEEYWIFHNENCPHKTKEKIERQLKKEREEERERKAELKKKERNIMRNSKMIPLQKMEIKKSFQKMPPVKIRNKKMLISEAFRSYLTQTLGKTPDLDEFKLKFKFLFSDKEVDAEIDDILQEDWTSELISKSMKHAKPKRIIDSTKLENESFKQTEVGPSFSSPTEIIFEDVSEVPTSTVGKVVQTEHSTLNDLSDLNPPENMVVEQQDNPFNVDITPFEMELPSTSVSPQTVNVMPEHFKDSVSVSTANNEDEYFPENKPLSDAMEYSKELGENSEAKIWYETMNLEDISADFMSSEVQMGSNTPDKFMDFFSTDIEKKSSSPIRQESCSYTPISFELPKMDYKSSTDVKFKHTGSDRQLESESMGRNIQLEDSISSDIEKKSASPMRQESSSFTAISFELSKLDFESSTDVKFKHTGPDRQLVCESMGRNIQLEESISSELEPVLLGPMICSPPEIVIETSIHFCPEKHLSSKETYEEPGENAEIMDDNVIMEEDVCSNFAPHEVLLRSITTENFEFVSNNSSKEVSSHIRQESFPLISLYESPEIVIETTPNQIVSPDSKSNSHSEENNEIMCSNKFEVDISSQYMSPELQLSDKTPEKLIESFPFLFPENDLRPTLHDEDSKMFDKPAETVCQNVDLGEGISSDLPSTNLLFPNARASETNTDHFLNLEEKPLSMKQEPFLLDSVIYEVPEIVIDSSPHFSPEKELSFSVHADEPLCKNVEVMCHDEGLGGSMFSNLICPELELRKSKTSEKSFEYFSDNLWKKPPSPPKQEPYLPEMGIKTFPPMLTDNRFDSTLISAEHSDELLCKKNEMQKSISPDLMYLGTISNDKLRHPTKFPSKEYKKHNSKAGRRKKKCSVGSSLNMAENFPTAITASGSSKDMHGCLSPIFETGNFSGVGTVSNTSFQMESTSGLSAAPKERIGSGLEFDETVPKRRIIDRNNELYQVMTDAIDDALTDNNWNEYFLVHMKSKK